MQKNIMAAPRAPVLTRHVSEEDFMEAVRMYPVIYNPSLVEFRNLRVKKNAWEKVAKELNVSDPANLQIRFKSLRRRASQCKKLYNSRREKSGAGVEDVDTGRGNDVELDRQLLLYRWLFQFIKSRPVVTNDPSR